jgi:hypothetical protein
MSKTQSIQNDLDKKNSLNFKEELKLEEDILKKPEEDNTRYGDWVKNGRTIDF